MSTASEVKRYLSGPYNDPDARYYMVGRLVRQDEEGTDPGYRETALCPICREPLKVQGPYLGRFNARCTECPIAVITGSTLGEIWAQVIAATAQGHQDSQNMSDS
jgi:hypothetical protein